MNRNTVANYFLLLLLGAIWGSSYLFMRIAGPSLGPVFLIGLRVVLAAGSLLLLGFFTGSRTDFRQRWKEYLLLGTITNAIPFTLIVSAVIDLNASLAAILNATTPMFTAIVASAFGEERFGLRKVLGAVAGLAGVVILVGLSPLPLTGRVVLAAGKALLAALSYGFGAVYSRKRFQWNPPLMTTTGQLIGSSLVMIPLSAFFVPATIPSIKVGLSVLALAVICTAAAYLVYFHLISRVGAMGAMTVTFLVPFFSLLWGIALLGEPLNGGMFLGLAVILFSVWLVMGARKRREEERPESIDPGS